MRALLSCADPAHWLSLSLLLTLVLAGPVFGQSVTLEPNEREALSKYLPRTLEKLDARQPVHVVFLGDRSVFESPGDGHPGASELFLKHLAARFFYAEGVHRLEDGVYPFVLGPHFTYEVLGDEGNTAFHINQRSTTDALVNDPSLAVLFAGPADAAAGVSPERYGTAMAGALGVLGSRGMDCLVLEPLALSPAAGRFGEVLGQVWPFVRELRDRLGAGVSGEAGRMLFDTNKALLPDRLVFGSPEDLAYAEEDLRSRLSELLTEGAALTRLGHEQLARALYETATGFGFAAPEGVRLEWRGATAERWQWSVMTAREDGPGGFLFPGWVEDWKPRQAAYGFPAAAGEGWPVTLVWEEAPRRRDGAPSPEAVRRLPCLAVDGDGLMLREVINPDATGRPRLEPAFAGNAPGQLEWTVLSGDGAASPAWKVAAVSAPWSSPFNLAPAPGREGAWLLSFPQGEDTARIGGEVMLTGGTGNAVWKQSFSGMRNLGLGEKVRLLPDDPEALGSAGSDGLIESAATFSAEADSRELRLFFDLRRVDLAGQTDGPVVELRLGLDARSYGERIGAGYIGTLVFQGDGGDGPLPVGPLEMALFGDGYARLPLGAALQASFGGRPNGDKRLAVVIRREAFYRHDWTLGNGNSQVGIRAELSLRLPDRTDPLRLRLLPTDRHWNDAEGVTILELTENPTKRWTVQLW
ncbi:MAG TPA: hypothetical protein VMN36_18750 [Verrucomicrobiales bacterium]|nr:hypothetical protein [Verrucomicrobiales bacterium]